MDWQPIAADALQSGRRYRVRVEDCCVQATLTGVLIRELTDEQGERIGWVFDFGTLEPEWGAYEFLSPAVDGPRTSE